jgi:hypothetical protein
MAKKVKSFEHRFFDVVTVGERGQVVISGRPNGQFHYFHENELYECDAKCSYE